MSKTTETHEVVLPRDPFSEAVRRFSKNPAAVKRQSIVEQVDDYGNLFTWVITTYRQDGKETVLLQWQGPTKEQSDRIVLPPQVTAKLLQHRDGAITVARRRRGRDQAAQIRAEIAASEAQ
jgi:hypothetical protein